ncbi:hypothetical protein EDD16DRAFT_1768677 [Pisolithus croceorrhizus]|nr:hypothetical protein EDD16DRAFT_1768677 [Pisolithus croceorrhizus]KAI6159952.1 hypothetical protein EDD17DRAFT_1510868 [Pisolithus thermaeus]
MARKQPSEDLQSTTLYSQSNALSYNLPDAKSHLLTRASVGRIALAAHVHCRQPPSSLSAQLRARNSLAVQSHDRTELPSFQIASLIGAVSHHSGIQHVRQAYKLPRTLLAKRKCEREFEGLINLSQGKVSESFGFPGHTISAVHLAAVGAQQMLSTLKAESSMEKNLYDLDDHPNSKEFWSLMMSMVGKLDAPSGSTAIAPPTT